MRLSVSIRTQRSLLPLNVELMGLRRVLTSQKLVSECRLASGEKSGFAEVRLAVALAVDRAAGQLLNRQPCSEVSLKRLALETNSENRNSRFAVQIKPGFECTRQLSGHARAGDYCIDFQPMPNTANAQSVLTQSVGVTMARDDMN